MNTQILLIEESEVPTLYRWLNVVDLRQSQTITNMYEATVVNEPNALQVAWLAGKEAMAKIIQMNPAKRRA